MNVKQINTAILGGEWTDAELNSILDAVRFVRGRIAQKNIFTMRAGASVQFTSNKNGQTYKGTVNKVGRKFITVATPQGFWRVPANMLTPA